MGLSNTRNFTTAKAVFTMYDFTCVFKHNQNLKKESLLFHILL